MTIAQIPFPNFMRRTAKRVSNSGELIVDNFAGGGGASTGIELALGRSVDIAINHDREAIDMHSRNHPQTLHLCEDVWAVDPVKACAGRPVGLAWFSPDCKHFSRAKGAKPVSKKIRGLAWVAVKWAKAVRPRMIMLENVREFQEWGPLVEKTYRPDLAKGVAVKVMRGEHAGKFGAVTEGNGAGQVCGVRLEKEKQSVIIASDDLRTELVTESMPCKARKGQTFARFVAMFKNLGYAVEWRVLNAADFGAPTHRRRLFIVARRDGVAIAWPEPTHGPGRKPYRTAAECIDWTIPCPSIFERKRPLAEKTMRRIAMGLKKYVFECAKPFIVNVQHGGDHFRGQGVGAPLGAVTAKHGYGVVTPYVCGVGGRAGQSPATAGDAPVGTVTAKNDRALITPILVGTGGPDYSAKPVSIDAPMGTLTAENHRAAVCAFLNKHYGGVVGQELEKPIGTITAVDHHSLSVAYLNKYRGDSPGSAACEPVPTITSGDGAARPAGAAHALGLSVAHLTKFYGTNIGSDPRNPMPTVSAQGLHIGEVRAFLIKYFGCGVGQECSEPLHTVTTKDRFGLITIEGQEYQIADIGLRMLTPRELLRAQFGPELAEDYVLPKSASAAVAKIGNSVAPLVAAALVRANMMPAKAAKVSA